MPRAPEKTWGDRVSLSCEGLNNDGIGNTVVGGLTCGGTRARARLRLLLCMLCASLAAGAAEVTQRTSSQTGLPIWTVRAGGLSLELAPQLPDFIQAVFTSRGIPQEAANLIAADCVFGTIVRNASEGVISYTLADWRAVTSDGQAHPVKAKAAWVSRWRELGVTFRWLLLPDEQTFNVGDWSQAFTTVELPRDTGFDLHVSWSERGEQHRAIVEGLRCAPAKGPQ